MGKSAVAGGCSGVEVDSKTPATGEGGPSHSGECGKSSLPVQEEVHQKRSQV